MRHKFRCSILPWVKAMRCKEKPSVITIIQTQFVPVLFHHYLLVLGLELKYEMVRVRVRLVEQHQVPSYYGTALCKNVMLLHSTVEKLQTCHRVLRFRPHSAWSSGHGIGRPGLTVTSKMADEYSHWICKTHRGLLCPITVHVQFLLLKTEVTPSKIAGGSRRCNYTF